MQIPPPLLAFLLGLAPGFEARYSVPLCIAIGGSIPLCVAAGLAAAAVLSVLLPAAGGKLVARIPPLEARARRVAERIRGRWEKAVEVGLALFVAAPLPATGVWSGAAVSVVLGLEARKASVALLIGAAASIAATTVLAAAARAVSPQWGL